MAKRKWGDRWDARYIKETPGMQTCMAHLYPDRVNNEAFLQVDLDITELLPYLEKVNASHPEYRTTVFQALVFAVTKMAYERPRMNHFVQGHRFYERNEISSGFVARRRFEDKSEECLMFFVPKPDDNLASLSHLIGAKVEHVRKSEFAEKGVDYELEKFKKVPRLLYMGFVRIIRYLDFWGINPKCFAQGDPNFATFFFSNLGSVGCPSVYHHLNNYGTNSCMIVMGLIHKAEQIMPDGSKSIRDMVDIGITVDERIADGFYFARSLKLVKYLFAHPEKMEESITTPSGIQY